MKGLSAQEIVAALSSEARPFQGMNLAGAEQLEHRNPVARCAAQCGKRDHGRRSRPRLGHAEQVPLSARGHAIYRSAPAELEVSEFNANTRSSQVRASGTLSTRVSDESVGQHKRPRGVGAYLIASGYRQRTPLNMRGRALFFGSATGRLAEIDFEGKLQSRISKS